MPKADAVYDEHLETLGREGLMSETHGFSRGPVCGGQAHGYSSKGNSLTRHLYLATWVW